MKSRITIDLDYDNQPIISVDYQESEDVRDKMIKRFLESFKSESCFLSISFKSDYLDKTKIRPIPPNELFQFEKIFNDIVLNNKEK